MKEIKPEYQNQNNGHYTPGIISNGMLYVSGQLAIDPDTKRVLKGGIEEHAKLALENIDEVLKEAGLFRDDIV